MDLQEIILSGSSTALQAHHVTSSTLLIRFKLPNTASNADSQQQDLLLSTRNLCSLLPARDDYPAVLCHVSTTGKGAAAFYNFTKEGHLLNCFLPVRLLVMATSHDGEYLAGGDADGRIYLWRLMTGALVNVFDAHLRPVTCLCWTKDSRHLITSGQDATLLMFPLVSMVEFKDASADPNVTPSLSIHDHRLPITDVLVNYGLDRDLQILTSSLDGTVKIYDFHEQTRSATFSFPLSSKVFKLALDPAGRAFFAIVQMPDESYRVIRQDLHVKLPQFDLPDGSTKEIRDSFWNQRSLNRVKEVGDAAYLSSEPLCAIHLSRFNPYVFVSTSSSILILSNPSLQLLKTINTSSTSPISYLESIIQPDELVTPGRRAPMSGQNEALLSRVASLATIKDTLEMRQNREEPFQWSPINADDILGIPRLLPFRETFEDSKLESERSVLTDRQVDRPSTFPSDSTLSASLSKEQDMIPIESINSELVNENALLKERLDKALTYNELLWKGVVEGTLKLETPSRS